MKKSSFVKTIAITLALSVSGTAYAQSFSYNTTLGGNPVVLTINTAAGTATYSGSGTNVTYSGGSLGAFDGNNPSGTLNFTAVSGQINTTGGVLTPLIGAGGPARVRFNGGSSTNLWTLATNSAGSNINFDAPSSFTPVVVTSSTSSGGFASSGGVSSSSSSSTSTGGSTGSTGGGGGGGGGTSVPAPGILGLFGLGLAGLAFNRRRKFKK